MVLYVQLQKEVEVKFREHAMKKFGYTKGALKEAVGEAVQFWLTSIPLLSPLPLSALRGTLRGVKEKSVDLKHSALELFTQ